MTCRTISVQQVNAEPLPLCVLTAEKPGTQVNMTIDELQAVITEAQIVCARQPALLEVEAPVQIVGDIHGQYHDLLRLLDHVGYPPDTNYLFLGDYVDRGKNGLECIALLLCYKIKYAACVSRSGPHGLAACSAYVFRTSHACVCKRYPEKFHLLRGNHESAPINRIYGFYDECKRRFKYAASDMNMGTHRLLHAYSQAQVPDSAAA